LDIKARGFTIKHATTIHTDDEVDDKATALLHSAIDDAKTVKKI